VTASFESWIERQYAVSAGAMQQSISPVGVVKARPGFGQTVVPVKGSVVASPVPASYDPDPDYFFHWYRDSAVVIDALRLLYLDGTIGEKAVADVIDFVRFSLALDALDGRKLVQSPGWRDRVATDFEQFVRPDEDLARAHGEAIRAETRVNPNGTLDISRWPRPQHDGPPMRALALLRWVRTGVSFDRVDGEALAALLREDLAFTRRHSREPCFDIWEEEEGLHYYSLCISAAALDEGAYWFGARGIRDEAAACREEAAALRQSLDGYWLAEEGFYRSRVLTSGARSSKELDMAVIFAAIHAGATAGAHSVSDPRMHATLARLERVFENAYAINRRREGGAGVAMGRYEGDAYYSGGAYYFSTLAAAEFCYRAAGAAEDRSGALVLRERGDAFLRTVQAFTPEDGALSEQFDQATGTQTSARHLAWSYAAFISSVTARRDLRATGASTGG
jgi:glucoamylase